MTNKAARWVLAALTWAAFLLRAATLGSQSLWRDEVDAIRFSNWPLKDLITGLFQANHNGPLFFLLLRFWRNLAGNTEFALRYPSALLGTMAVPLGFILARQLGFRRVTGLLLSLLLATSPYLIWYGQEAKMYSLLVGIIMLAFVGYFKALTGAARPSPFSHRSHRWAWWAIFIGATTISYYVHILAPLMIPVYALTALLHPVALRRHWRGWLISMGILILPYLPLAVWQGPRFLAGYQSGHPFYPFKEQFYLLLQLYSSGLIRFAPADVITAFASTGFTDFWQNIILFLQKPLFGLIPIVLHVFLFICGLLLGLNLKAGADSRRRLTLALWTLIPPLLAYLVSLRVPIFEDRYLIYILPAFYLMAMWGLTLLHAYNRRLAGLCLILILIFNATGIWQQQRRPIKADFRAAAEYIARQPYSASTIMIQIPYLQHTFNYYYPHDFTLLEGLWTNDNKQETAVDAEMTALTAEVSDVWLVVSEEALWDQRQLVRGWLDENAALVDEAHFMRVDVYHYQLRPGTIEEPGISP